MSNSSDNRPVDERLREDLERLYPKGIEQLESALDAEKEHYMTCPECNKRSPVRFPDVRALIEAMKFMAEYGYGKPKQAEPQPSTTGRVLSELDDHELEAIAAGALAADRLRSVTRPNGDG